METVKTWFVGYAGSRPLCTREGGDVTYSRTSASLKGGVLCPCSSLLTAFDKAFSAIGWQVDLSKGKWSLQLNGLLPSDSSNGMLEGKDC